MTGKKEVTRKVEVRLGIGVARKFFPLSIL